MFGNSDLTKGPILKHIAALAIPAAVGFFFNTLYNLVDTLFARFISTEAQSALGFAFPIFFIIVAGSVGLGQGTTALMSNAIGEKKSKTAIAILGQSLVLAAIITTTIMLIIFLFADQIYRSMGATGEALALAKVYIYLVALGVPGFVFGSAMNGALNSHGDTSTFGIALIGGTFLNAIFNAMFVWGFGWGMAGIGLATFVVQYISLAFIWYRLRRSESGSMLSLSDLKPKIQLLKEGAIQSFPASFNMMMIAVGFFIVTTFFARFGDPAVAASSISNRLGQLFLLPAIGMNLAVLAIGGQNFGAKAYDRVRLLYALAMKLCLAFTVVGGVIMFASSGFLVSIFTSDDVVSNYAVLYLKFQALSLPALLLVIIPVSLMQALKQPLFGPIINGLRLVIVPLILFTILLDWYGFGIEAIFWGELANFWILGILTFALSFWMMKTYLPKTSPLDRNTT